MEGKKNLRGKIRNNGRKKNPKNNLSKETGNESIA